MKLSDHFKRAFSAVFNDRKPFTSLAAVLITTAASLGPAHLIDADPETTSSASIAVRQDAIEAYRQEFEKLKNPDPAEALGAFDARAKNIAVRLVQDDRLTEAETGALMHSFKTAGLQKPPYPWLEKEMRTSRDFIDMNYLNECRADHAGKDAGEIYTCAVDRESSNEGWTAGTALVLGLGSFLGLGIFGVPAGGRWDKERKRRKLEEAAKNPPPASPRFEPEPEPRPAPPPAPPREPAPPAPKPAPKLRLY